MKRRDFLKLSGTFFAAATLSGLPACGGGGGDGGTYLFPQGVASGDPRATSVVLWTRVVFADGSTDDVTAQVEVASDAGFTDVVVRQEVSATLAADHTVRVVVTGLAPATRYFYRFTAGSDSIVGRTNTAPAANADVPVQLAWISCQDYAAGHYGALRQLIADDEARAEADRIQVVIHLGDFIYETRGSRFQVPLDDNLEPLTLNNPDGTPRTVPAFPSGGGQAGSDNFAQNVDDYRHLYRHYLTDPDLQAARARWPFIHTWDDHEFTNDCWQSQANYVEVQSLNEGSQSRKVAANQAWFEYVPVQLSGAEGVVGVVQHARDFTAAAVSDAMFSAPNADNFVDEPNNTAAVGSITIYRSFRFGQHMELVVTDQRSYRSDHAIPEELSWQQLVFFDPRNAVPFQMVEVFDAGMTANGGNPPATVLGYDNPRTTSPPGTMLGAAQKAWWKDTMRLSDATWKVWGNEVPLMRFLIRQGTVSQIFTDRVISADAWDGYPAERTELTTYLRDQGIDNVVVISGDIHAAFAGKILDDYNSGTPQTVGIELVAAGISSNSLFSFYEDATRGLAGTDVRNIITYDASASGGPTKVENMNMMIRHGTRAAVTMSQTNDVNAALAEADPLSNPHLSYVDTNAQGYGLLSVTAAQVTGTLVTINRPVVAVEGPPGIKRSVRYVIPAGNPDGTTGPEITGTKPFPLT